MRKNRNLIGRRQFIATSAWAIAAGAISPKLFAGQGTAPTHLAVGFAPFDAADRVVPAADIPAGDGGFIGRGARLSVSGTSGAAGDPKAQRTVELLVRYSYLDGAERKEAPFRAWAASRTTGCQGSPVSFTVPVDEVQRISLSMAVQRGERVAGAPTTRRQAAGSGTVAEESFPVVLTLLSGAGTLKLARGFYILVPLFDQEREPAWSRYTLKNAEGRWALHDRDGNVAPFEHFVLRIDIPKSRS